MMRAEELKMKRAEIKASMSNSRSKFARGQERGFTILETAIAFTIMFTVGLATTGLFLFANGYNSGATDRALAIAVARQQMEQLRNVQFTDALLTIPSGSAVTSTSTISNGGKNYTVTKTIEYMTACTGCNKAKKITITVTPQDSSPLWGANPVSVVTIRSDSTTGPYYN
jgi:type II secretory pathway pseudopilin PulG